MSVERELEMRVNTSYKYTSNLQGFEQILKGGKNMFIVQITKKGIIWYTLVKGEVGIRKWNEIPASSQSMGFHVIRSYFLSPYMISHKKLFKQWSFNIRPEYFFVLWENIMSMISRLYVILLL